MAHVCPVGEETPTYHHVLHLDHRHARYRLCPYLSLLWSERLVRIALSIGNVVVSVRSVFHAGVSISDPTFQVHAFAILGKATKYWIAELALSWATNVFATIMIAIQAWYACVIV